jgi:hypothetical protein
MLHMDGLLGLIEADDGVAAFTRRLRCAATCASALTGGVSCLSMDFKLSGALMDERTFLADEQRILAGDPDQRSEWSCGDSCAAAGSPYEQSLSILITVRRALVDHSCNVV